MELFPRLMEGSRRVEQWISIAALALMSALPLIEIAGRRLAGGGIPGSIPVVQHLTLWITFLGAALAARSDRLLALSTGSFLPEVWRAPVRLVSAACGAAVSGCLLVASLDLVSVEREAGDILGWRIPVWVAVSIMPIGFGLIAGRLIWRCSPDWKGRLLATSFLAIPVLLALYKEQAPAGLLVPGGLAILAVTALGMPIFAALAGTALLFFYANGVPIAAVPAETYRLAASPMLPAIPLFTLGGYIFSEGGASKRLMRTFTALVGWMPGGLAIVTTLVLAFFTPFTGASGVTILSMGGLLLPVLLKARYPEQTAVGLVTVSGSIGLLFPPSLPVIMYGIYAMTPIDRLFIAGFLPGLLLVVVVAAWGAWRGWSAGAAKTPFQGRELLAALWEAKWEMLLPVVVLIGIFGGFATLVEAAALTVLYALVVECFVYGDLGVRRDLPRIAVECSTLAGGFLIILGAALGFTNYLIHAEIPTLALNWVRLHIQSPLLFLLALNGFLLIVGMLMDIYSAILVIVPLITPMGLAYGIDPVHLAIVFLANLELGYLTPPVGANLFLSSYRFKQPLSKIYLATVPYSIILLGAVLLITYLPYLLSS
ncbi:MAG: TRAP transporter large permease subunit [Bryobacteraceae bacterium]